MDLFSWWWNVDQDRRLREASSAIDRAQTRQQLDLERLDGRVDSLLLLNAALWEMLRDRVGVTDHELMAKMQEIDLRDGEVDGRVSGPPKACTKCKRPNAARRSSCLYCGAPLAAAGPFDRVR